MKCALRALAAAALLLVVVATPTRGGAEPWRASLEERGRVRGTLEIEQRPVGDGWETRERVAIAVRGAGEGGEASHVDWLRVEVTTREDARGDVLAWSRAVVQGRVRRELRAERRGDAVHVSGGLGAARRERVLSAPERWRGPVALAAEIEAMLGVGSGAVRHREIAADGASFASVTLTRAEAPPLESGLVPLDERTRSAPGAESGLRVAWDPRARRLIHAYGVQGTRFVVRPRAASGRIAAGMGVEPLDLFEGQLVASPFRIPAEAARGTIRLAFETKGSAPFAPPETAEQSVLRNRQRTIVTICANCGREPAPTAQALASALAPTEWIESDAPRLVRMARRGIDPEAPVAERMEALVWKVKKRLNGPVDPVGYATALESLAARRGDCGEFALLLAAFARANGIPARVVFGLVYSSRFTGRPHVFSPHAWVQAWDGAHWVSYDAGAGPFDATHVALALGDGSPESFAAVTRSLAGLRIAAAARIESAAGQGATR